ncbi:hypothetical protein PanWU01x14_349560 [Parasponia andersonii]|uniref:Uncharacterized protein n=1 Tax=Parasponia andersonii TaxID=3476 RepID=A0A2P5ABB1_PARAD|nr:hypothetical protein PanWU01x14_349560 [Parasponia andersonii]
MARLFSTSNGLKKALRRCTSQVLSDVIRSGGALSRIVGTTSDIYLHRDKSLMPQNPAAWSAWNFLGSRDNKVCLTYWLNVLQNLGETSLPLLVTLNPEQPPNHTLLKWSAGHPVPSIAASRASLELSSNSMQERNLVLWSIPGLRFPNL